MLQAKAGTYFKITFNIIHIDELNEGETVSSSVDVWLWAQLEDVNEGEQRHVEAGSSLIIS